MHPQHMCLGCSDTPGILKESGIGNNQNSYALSIVYYLCQLPQTFCSVELNLAELPSYALYPAKVAPLKEEVVSGWFRYDRNGNND